MGNKIDWAWCCDELLVARLLKLSCKVVPSSQLVITVQSLLYE
jgi:hypothetical protein